MLLMHVLFFIQAHIKGISSKEELAAKTRKLRYSEHIMAWIDEHYMEFFQLQRLADSLHLSKFYTSRVFLQETGSTISDYLTVRRIKEACRLLQTTTLSVEQISREIGFPNTSYFCKMFKRNLGTTPLKYQSEVMKLDL
jgi:YesN/AraC family two-component response regulator